jgi:hypothetical protein
MGLKCLSMQVDVWCRSFGRCIVFVSGITVYLGKPNLSRKAVCIRYYCISRKAKSEPTGSI